MTKEERLKAAAEYVARRYGWMSNTENERFQSHFLAGAEAEAESNKSVSVQDAKQFMWEWLNKKQLLDIVLDNDDIQLLMADFANHLHSHQPLNQQ